jgi:YHS domain-containing protein
MTDRPEQAAKLPPLGSLVPTACGGEMPLEADTLYAYYKGELVAFCAQSCVKAFKKYPDAFMQGMIPHFEDI